MDLSYKDHLIKRCFKLPRELLGNVNVKYHESTGLLILWNTYQIFIYDDLTFETPKVFIPEFNIENLIISNNYLICLDDSGNIHLTPLKFKHSAQKKFKSSFQPREQGIQCIDQFTNDKTISIKFTLNMFYVCTHKINTDFQIDTEIKILFDGISLGKQRKPWIFHIYLTSPSEYDQIKDLHKQKDPWKEHAIILITLDRSSVYSILFSSRCSDACIYPIKLYTSPSEIVNLNIIKPDCLCGIISLGIGTVIKVPLMKIDKVDIVHLNTAIYKLYPIKDTMIYCDGSTMWKSEETFTASIKFQKCVVKHVKDFVIIKDKLLCTTFSNLVYSIPLDGSFKELAIDKYCPADEVLDNNNCLEKIMSEVEKCNEIIKKIKKEESHITALSLSNRNDIMDEIINYNVSVYEAFDDIPKDDLTLIDNIGEYYNMNSIYFLINIEMKPQIEKFNELLTNMFGNLKIHLVLASETCIKTATLNVAGQLKKMNIVVPLCIKNLNFSKITVDIKLITSIAEVFDANQNVWTILHSKKVILNSEHFIRTFIPNDQVHFINKFENISDTIYNTTVNQFGHLYKFNKSKRKGTQWSMFVKLTDNFEKSLNNDIYLNKCFSSRKSITLLKQLISDDFVKSKNDLALEIGEDRVHLKIINDGFTKPIIKVSCENIEKAFFIRNFLSELVHNNFFEFDAGREFVDHVLYSTVERFEKTIQDAINRFPFSKLEFINLFEKYQKNVIGRLPL